VLIKFVLCGRFFLSLQVENFSIPNILVHSGCLL
jgi:hypothetical protein